MTGSWRSSWCSRSTQRILHRRNIGFLSLNLFLVVFTNNMHKDAQGLSLFDMQWFHKDSRFYSASNTWSLNQLWHLSLAHLAGKKAGGKTHNSRVNTQKSWYSHLLLLEDIFHNRIIIPSTSQKSTSDLIKRTNPLMTLTVFRRSFGPERCGQSV